MITRALLFASLLPLSALAQIQLFQFDGTKDTPVGALLDVGTASPGDIIVTRFHVRNTGPGKDSLDQLSLSGFGFQIVNAPFLKYSLAPDQEVEFDVSFSPTSLVSYSASLSVNTIGLLLVGDTVGSATLTVSGITAPLVYGATVDFGSAAVGTTQTETFMLYNSSNAAITVKSVTISGAGFSGPLGLSLPVSLGSAQSASFQVSFTPQSGTVYHGTLTVDRRTFNLTGQGLTPSLPSASIVFASTVGASAQQNSLSIPLASPSQAKGTGTLTMAFQPSVADVANDVAIQFLSGPQRKATVSIAIGDTSATIGGLSKMAFQTGSTAGTITFTLTLPNGIQQSTLTIPPSPINLDAVTAVRRPGALDVAFSTFDNTYSASQLAFTFYDLKGNALQSAMDVNAGAAFQQYFGATQAGGMFALLATFPVTGDTSLIGFVTAQITNSAGITTAHQIPFTN